MILFFKVFCRKISTIYYIVLSQSPCLKSAFLTPEKIRKSTEILVFRGSDLLEDPVNSTQGVSYFLFFSGLLVLDTMRKWLFFLKILWFIFTQLRAGHWLQNSTFWTFSQFILQKNKSYIVLKWSRKFSDWLTFQYLWLPLFIRF